MIKDPIQQSSKKYPNKILLNINNKNTTYSQFDSDANQIVDILKTRYAGHERIKLNFKDKYLLLVGIIACNRSKKIPIIMPDSEKTIKGIDYGKLAKASMEMNDKGCIIQDDTVFDCGDFKYAPGAVQCVLFTSGTSCSPKAVELTFGNIYENACGWNKVINFKKEDIYLNILPLYHISGLSIFFRSIYFDFLSIIKGYDRENDLDFIKKNKVTIVSLVPKIINDILSTNNVSLLRYLKAVIVGGDSINEKIFIFLKNNKINGYISYGMTETSSGISGYWTKREQFYKKGYLGEAHLNARLSLVDSRITINSPSVMKRYVGSKLNKKIIQTSDLGKFCNHEIYFLRRDENVIISGGKNINMNLIKLLINRDDINSNVLVLGVENKIWGEVPIVVYNKNFKNKINKLKQLISKKLPKYMQPKKFLYLEKLSEFNNYKINIIDKDEA